MKKHLIICLILLTALLLTAQESPVRDYFANPGAVSFTAAWDYCSQELAKDSTKVSIKILMANLAANESKRLSQEIQPEFHSLAAGAKFQFANLLLAQNRLEDSVDMYNAINLEYPKWSCPWRHKGEALYLLKRYKDAEKSIAKSIETNPEHYDAYVWMAKIQYKLKKYKPALKNLEIAMTLNPEEEESPDEVISEDSIRALHEVLLIKTGKKK
jgi:tetratricopeptide (TPR) repeat protein